MSYSPWFVKLIFLKILEISQEKICIWIQGCSSEVSKTGVSDLKITYWNYYVKFEVASSWVWKHG